MHIRTSKYVIATTVSKFAVHLCMKGAVTGRPPETWRRTGQVFLQYVCYSKLSIDRDAGLAVVSCAHYSGGLRQ